MLRQQPNTHQELIASLIRHASPQPAKPASAEDLNALGVTPLNERSSDRHRSSDWLYVYLTA